MKYLKYLKYIARHKWYVMIECFKLGLIWRGLMHDMSKFLPSEFFAYANYFYGYYPEKLNAYEKTYHSELKTKKDVEIEFNIAWNHHQKRNKHHWQYWLLKEDDGKLLSVGMPKKYLKEMLWSFFLVIVIVFMWSVMAHAQMPNPPPPDQAPWTTANQVTIAWDAVTTLDNGDPVPTGDQIVYDVFVYNYKGSAMTQVVTGGASTSVTITFNIEGRYVAGVRVKRIVDAGTPDEQILESQVNWSNVNGVNTPNPFGLRYFINPSVPINLRIPAS